MEIVKVAAKQSLELWQVVERYHNKAQFVVGEYDHFRCKAEVVAYVKAEPWITNIEIEEELKQQDISANWIYEIKPYKEIYFFEDAILYAKNDYEIFSRIVHLADKAFTWQRAYKKSGNAYVLCVSQNTALMTLKYEKEMLLGVSVEEQEVVMRLAEKLPVKCEVMSYEKYCAELYREMKKEREARERQEKEENMKGEDKAKREAEKFLSLFTEPEFDAYMRGKVLGQEELNRINYSIYVYIESIAEGRPWKNNILLAAPSGCGKTEYIRALKELFREKQIALPILTYDSSMLTEQGFKGSNPDTILKGLEESGYNGFGIVFLDEFDKKLVPSYTGQGSNVNLAVQANLLTMIEGREVPASNKNVYDEDGVDTNRTLFVGMGAFQSVRDARKEQKTVGFGNGQQSESQRHYSKITMDDIIETGCCYELLGRFSVLVNFHELSDETIRSIVLKYIDQMPYKDFKIEITEDAMVDFVKLGNSQYGCRLLWQKLYGAVMKADMEFRQTAGCVATPKNGVVKIISTEDAIYMPIDFSFEIF